MNDTSGNLIEIPSNVVGYSFIFSVCLVRRREKIRKMENIKDEEGCENFLCCLIGEIES